MVVYGCDKELPPERQHTALHGFKVSQTELATVSEPRGELAPLPRHTHNMKGGPLNVMEVV